VLLKRRMIFSARMIPQRPRGRRRDAKLQLLMQSNAPVRLLPPTYLRHTDPFNIFGGGESLLTTSAAYRANAHKPPAKTNVVLDIKGSVFLTFCLSLFHTRLMTSRSLLPVHPRVHPSDTLTHAQVGRHDGLQEDGGAREGGAEREREREREGGAERERERERGRCGERERE
jgi:hypothetical protein